MQKNHAKRTALALFLLFAVTVSAQAAKIAEVIPIGHAVGIKMQAEGVLIVQLTEVQGADGTRSPAKEAGVQEGDVLCRAGETALHSNDDLQKQVALSAGQPIKLTLERGDAEKSVTVTPCRDKTGAYRIGVLARDSLAGIGTLTYVDPQTGAFGSLGHGICDSETGVLLPLQEGTIIHSTVSSVQRGKAGEPGSLQGEFSTEKSLGTVAQNTAAYLGAMKNPAVQIIGHPDDGRFPIDYETLVCAAKEHHVLLEVNSSSLHPECHRLNARENYITMLELCRKHHVSIIMDSDAHSDADVGNHTRAQALLEEIGFPEELVVNTSIDKAADYIPYLNKPLYLGGQAHD